MWSPLAELVCAGGGNHSKLCVCCLTFLFSSVWSGSALVAVVVVVVVVDAAAAAAAVTVVDVDVDVVGGGTVAAVGRLSGRR